MTAKTYAGLIREIARDAETIATRGQGLVSKLVCAAMVYAKQNNRTLGTGLDHAEGALDGLAPVTEGFFKKAASYARAVVDHGLIDGTPLKARTLASVEEADMIAEAMALAKQVNVTAALEARVKANAGKKGGRPATKPAAAVAPAPALDPLLAAEQQAIEALTILMDAHATDAIHRIMAVVAARQAPEQAREAA